MRVCPSCGHVDPIWWLPAAMHPEIHYAHLDTVELMDPELWAMLKDRTPGELVERSPYLYWKSSRSDTVRRIWIEDFKIVGKSGSDMERVEHSPQTKLRKGGKPITKNVNRLYVVGPQKGEEVVESTSLKSTLPLTPKRHL